MILLIENQCKGWIHNRVNTGLIKAVRTACPQKTIKLCAEAGHIQGVKELLSEDGIEIDCEEIKELSLHVRIYRKNIRIKDFI